MAAQENQNGGYMPAEMTAVSDQSRSSVQRHTALRNWVAVLFLMVVGIFNVTDRLLPSVLAEPIKTELHLSDTALGLINGLGFLVVYAVVGIPIARLSDRGRYGLVVGVCLALWSSMTMLGAATQAGWQMALTRMGVAVGEAGSSPAAHAFISRNFAPHRRSAPLAVLTLSVPFATMGGNLVGGLLGQSMGWRGTFLLMGGVGLLLAPLALLLLPTASVPETAERTAHRRASGRAGVIALLKKPSYQLILLASACIGIGGYALTAFGIAFLMRVHGLSLAEIGVQYGIGVGVAGVIGLLVTAQLADRLSARDPRWTLWIVALMIALILPFAAGGFVLGNRTAVLVCMTLTNIVAIAYGAPVVAAIQRLAPIDARATASAIFLFCVSLFGGLGPLIAGMLSDAMRPQYGALALGRALLIVVPVAYGFAALFYALATRCFIRDMVVEDGVSA